MPTRPFRRLSPPALLALALAATILIGTVLLRLPIAHADEPIGWLDAFFTAASAACVTGLVVVDTGSAFSGFGQAVILALIQIGGLGVMTIGTMVMLALGFRPGPSFVHVVRGFSSYRTLRVRHVLWGVVLLALVVETVGAAVLFVAFSRSLPAGEALWQAVFHSVSAFCNAGFSLWSDSLTRWTADPLVNFTVMALVVLGGLGFVVLLEIRRWLGSRLRRHGPLEHFSLHSRIMLAGTGIAIVAGFVLVLALEAGNVLAGRPWGERLLAALFQSVTARTAGFNSIPTDGLANPTLLFLIALMFVGAGPGSTGGGIKLTSAATVLAFTTQRLRGHNQPRLFGRGIGEVTLERAVIMAVLGILLIGVAFAGMEIARHGGAPTDAGRGEVLAVLFEVVSAFGTVGLSMGITSELGSVSRLLLIGLMFLGRLGPLVLMDYFARRRTDPPIRHVTEELMIA